MTTSWDGSLGHRGGQQSLCQVSHSFKAFRYQWLDDHLCHLLFDKDWQEGEKMMQVMKNTMSTKAHRPRVPGSPLHMHNTCTGTQHELKDRWDVVCVSVVEHQVKAAHLSSNLLVVLTWFLQLLGRTTEEFNKHIFTGIHTNSRACRLY